MWARCGILLFSYKRLCTVAFGIRRHKSKKDLLGPQQNLIWFYSFPTWMYFSFMTVLFTLSINPTSVHSRLQTLEQNRLSLIRSGKEFNYRNRRTEGEFIWLYKGINGSFVFKLISLCNWYSSTQGPWWWIGLVRKRCEWDRPTSICWIPGESNYDIITLIPWVHTTKSKA